ncbi:MAG: hypothetical protein LBH60_07635 [Prevotellaceae bacterium]|jgi:hypothetical protein|nr:hypothetical protein [Prevotellaceae bacterium]
MMNKEKTQPVYKIKWLLLLPVALLILLSLNMKRAIATNADFAVSSETVEPEPELIAESDTVANTGKGIIGKYDSDSLNIPLFVIDGKESHWTELENLSQELIYSFRILKEDTAIKLYGEKGKNGVMFIVTKGENVPKLSEDSTAKTYFFEPVDNINVVVKKAASFKKPLIIFDGKEKNIDIHNIDHQSIRSVTVLKNENATKLYGKNGENGVVIIKTKNAEP